MRTATGKGRAAFFFFLCFYTAVQGRDYTETSCGRKRFGTMQPPKPLRRRLLAVPCSLGARLRPASASFLRPTPVFLAPLLLLLLDREIKREGKKCWPSLIFSLSQVGGEGGGTEKEGKEEQRAQGTFRRA